MNVQIDRKLIATMRGSTGAPKSAVAWTYRVGLNGSDHTMVASVRRSLENLVSRNWVRKMTRTRPPKYWLAGTDDRRQGMVRKIFSDRASTLRAPGAHR